MAPSQNIAAFRKALQESQNLIVVAGAGLSAGSGLSSQPMLSKPKEFLTQNLN